MGQKLKQQPAHSAPPAPALEILVDPEFEDAGAAGQGEHQDKVRVARRPCNHCCATLGNGLLGLLLL